MLVCNETENVLSLLDSNLTVWIAEPDPYQSILQALHVLVYFLFSMPDIFLTQNYLLCKLITEEMSNL